MNGLIIFVVVIIGIVFALGGIAAALGGSDTKKTKKTVEPDIWPFYKSKVMTTVEQQLYWRLMKACPQYMILAQVQASRVIRVKKGNNFQYWFNRINRTSYDFVVCDKSSYPLAVIELDDSSHRSEKRQADDERKNKALAGADLPICRWDVGHIPDDEEIKRILAGYGRNK